MLIARKVNHSIPSWPHAPPGNEWNKHDIICQASYPILSHCYKKYRRRRQNTQASTRERNRPARCLSSNEMGWIPLDSIYQSILVVSSMHGEMDRLTHLTWPDGPTGMQPFVSIWTQHIFTWSVAKSVSQSVRIYLSLGIYILVIKKTQILTRLVHMLYTERYTQFIYFGQLLAILYMTAIFLGCSVEHNRVTS
jgi:hypothetical protein